MPALEILEDLDRGDSGEFIFPSSMSQLFDQERLRWLTTATKD